jgi:hypothetical protein
LILSQSESQTFFSVYESRVYPKITLNSIIVIEPDQLKSLDTKRTNLQVQKIAGGAIFETRSLVFSNPEYIYIRVFFIEDGQIVKEFGEGFVDRKNNVFYDITERVFSFIDSTGSAINGNEIIGENADSISVKLKSLSGKAIYLTFGMDVPKEVSYRCLFSKSTYGLKSIRTSYETTILVSFKPASFNFKKKLKLVRRRCVFSNKRTNTIYMD